MCLTLTNYTGWLMSASATCLRLAPSDGYLMLSLLIGLVRGKTQTGISCGGRYSCWHFRGNVTFNVWVLFYWRSWHWQETEMLPIERSVSGRCCLLGVFALFHKSSGWTWNFSLSGLMSCSRQTGRTKRATSPGPSLITTVCWGGGVFFAPTSLHFLRPVSHSSPTPIYCCTGEVIFRAHLIV